MARFLNILFSIGLVGAAAYFLFIKDNSFNYKFENLNFNKDRIMAIATTTATNLKEEAGKLVSVAYSKAEDLGSSLFSSAVEKVKDYAFEAVKQTAEDSLNKLGEKVGVSINSSDAPAENYVIYSVKKQEDAYFTIKNSETTSLSYRVDWLDGKVDSGQLIKNGDSAVLVHSWSKPGEYVVDFDITTSKEQKKYKILISVLN